MITATNSPSASGKIKRWSVCFCHNCNKKRKEKQNIMEKYYNDSVYLIKNKFH